MTTTPETNGGMNLLTQDKGENHNGDQHTFSSKSRKSLITPGFSKEGSCKEQVGDPEVTPRITKIGAARVGAQKLRTKRSEGAIAIRPRTKRKKGPQQSQPLTSSETKPSHISLITTPLYAKNCKDR